MSLFDQMEFSYADYSEAIYSILDAAHSEVSDVLPSVWCEENRYMTPDVSPIPGMFSYENSPYTREIVDCLSPSHPARRIAVMKGAQIGFALDIETLIPTPKGMVKMKNIKVGDWVFSENGKKIKVTKATDVMYNHKCYDVHFTDGTVIKCDAQHLWTVKDLKNIERVLDTESISKRVKRIPKNKNQRSRNRYYVENSKPLQFTKKKLPIEPYLLGLWLGDGSTNGNKITCDETDLKFYVSELESRSIKTKYSKYKDYEHIYHLMIIDEFNTWKGGKNIYGNKHIPEIYFNSSIEQRLSLLQGLIDTDGHVMKDGKVEFYNTNKKLINQVRRLISSLGYKVTIRKRDNTDRYTTTHETKRYKMKDLYVLNFMGCIEKPVALLPRKKQRLRSIKDIRKEVNKRWICNVIECDSVPVKCISVDSDTNLFLASESYIPTHNSTGVIEAGIGWVISQNPGNILFLVGHEDLVKDAATKIDRMIDNSGIREYIKSNSLKTKNRKTGDTDTRKDYKDGYLKIGIANHKALRNISMQYGFIDDFESMRSDSKESGSTKDLVEQRFAAFAKKMKLFYISTPELKETSNIEPVYLMGDQRKYHVPCPCCGEFIALEWTIESEKTKGKMAGITWELDDSSQLIAESVGYTCQKCEGFFNDSNKSELVKMGKWIPTAEPSRPGNYSYHISSLYAPPYMFGWEHYVRSYLEAKPPNGKVKEEKWKTFKNLVLGETYEPTGESISANKLQKNIRNYEPSILPENISLSDGNGKIVMLTCGSDLNGKEDDARLDFEIIAHSESGATYSVTHGSVGTFVPRGGGAKDRNKFTYRHGLENSVWPIFEKIINSTYKSDFDGREMKIFMTGLDSGYMTQHAYKFLDSYNGNIVALKGKDDDKYIAQNADLKTYRVSKERAKLYLVESNHTKDLLAEQMNLNWTKETGEKQPYGFMNFPKPTNGLYEYHNYFSHFEAEHKVVDKKGGYRWLKKSRNVQNHLFDCRLYGMVVKDILLDQIFKQMKIKNGTWNEYVQLIKNIEQKK